MNRFLIIRFGSIGNTLVSIPAVRALKKHYPDSFMAMVVSPGIDDLISDIKWIDETIIYDMHGRHKRLYGYLGFIRELRKRHFDTAIMFKRFLRSELIGLFSGAKRRIGFQTGGTSNFLTDRVDYREGENIVELNMKLVGPLGINSGDLSLELGIDNCPASAGRAVIDELKSRGSGKYAVIHPGGKTVRGQGLSPGSYADIINRLGENYHIPSVIIGDTPETGTIDTILHLIKAGSASAVIGLPLKQITCIIKYASVFIGNDSGPCHIADAVGTPGIIIYPPVPGLAEHIKKWKPAGKRYIAVSPPKSCDACPAYPCDEDTRAACISTIDNDLILNYTLQIINKEV